MAKTQNPGMKSKGMGDLSPPHVFPAHGRNIPSAHTRRGSHGCRNGVIGCVESCLRVRNGSLIPFRSCRRQIRLCLSDCVRCRI
jgi:hypothetical protein